MKRMMATLHGMGILLGLAVYLAASVIQLGWLAVTYPLRNLRK